APHIHSSTEPFILPEVQPRLQAAVAQSVPLVGAEDVQELVQDGTVIALRLQTKPQIYARIGGVLYLFIIATGLFAQAFLQAKLIVPAHAAATATNIMPH